MLLLRLQRIMLLQLCVRLVLLRLLLMQRRLMVLHLIGVQVAHIHVHVPLLLCTVKVHLKQR